MSKVFIVVPSDSGASPVKGAYALANALVSKYSVRLVFLKKNEESGTRLDPRVQKTCLADLSVSFIGKVRAYKRMLIDEGAEYRVISISYCFSADMLNIACREHAITVSSIRGNLVNAYRNTYGITGVPLAKWHLFSLRYMDHVIAMSNKMHEQILRHSGKRAVLIPNFIDEEALSMYRQNPVHETRFCFIFMGALSHLKKPLLFIHAIKEIRDHGYDVEAKILGHGPLVLQAKKMINRLGVSGYVTLQGHLSNPYEILSRSNVMVLPSISEGMSRAALEALYLGVPCVLRDVDGNSELIRDGWNGILFEKDDDLAAAMQNSMKLSASRANADRGCLLPVEFRESRVVNSYLDFVEHVNAEQR